MPVELPGADSVVIATNSPPDRTLIRTAQYAIVISITRSHGTAESRPHGSCSSRI